MVRDERRCKGMFRIEWYSRPVLSWQALNCVGFTCVVGDTCSKVGFDRISNNEYFNKSVSNF